MPEDSLDQLSRSRIEDLDVIFSIVFKIKHKLSIVSRSVPRIPKKVPGCAYSQGLLIIKSSRSHSSTPHLVGLLWTSDQPTLRPLPDNTQHSQQTFMPHWGLNTQSQQASVRRSTLQDHIVTGIVYDQLLKKFNVFDGFRMYIAVATKARHLTAKQINV